MGNAYHIWVAMGIAQSPSPIGDATRTGESYGYALAAPVACGGASAVLGSQCVAERSCEEGFPPGKLRRVPHVVAPGVFPQVKHLALETLQRALLHQRTGSPTDTYTKLHSKTSPRPPGTPLLAKERGGGEVTPMNATRY
ncbi:hypothetical protein BZZ01_31805 [Nostocales cyanobacterium HT-58-2]|nr:hypothetical protein BZZ01_31805 [Nostocales cyanobacterium HT-58-2]